MPTFRKTLPPAGRNTGYELHRTPPGSPLHGIITCDELLVCDTHYWHGRTTPCERLCNENGATTDDTMCPACVDKIGYRTHAYVTAYDAKTGEQFLAEFTACAARPLADYHEHTGTLRGCAFTAQRSKPSQNAKVLIVTHTANLARIELPNAPDIADALAIIWRLPRHSLNSQSEHQPDLTVERKPARRAKQLHPDPRRLRQQREQQDNAGTDQRRAELLAGLAKAAQNGNGHTP